MKVSTQIDRELLRKAALRFLSERFRIALDTQAICRLMAAKHYVDGEFDEDDLMQALTILVDQELIGTVTEPLGSTSYYQVTGKGIIANERING